MPLLHQHTITGSGYQILIWNLTETEEELLMFLNTHTISIPEGYFSIKHLLRRKQKLATHLLINHLTEGKGFQITYNALGKPELLNHCGSISISHSPHHVGLIHHTELKTGIDLEEPDGRILNIAGRFINEEEQKWLNFENPEKDYYLIWGVKECAFKAIGGGGIDFKNHLKVGKPESRDNLEGTGTVLFTKSLEMQPFRYYYRYLEDYLLVYTIALKPIIPTSA
ncbi:hypothetical protein BH11BAC2_BH11BAC2_14650 [soil metagenome]